MAGFTNKGKAKMLNNYCRAVAGSVPSASFFVLMATNATPPNSDINKTSDIVEITAGNGYVQGGIAVNRNTTDFDTNTEDDTNDRGLVQIKDLVWTAAGGSIPSAGGGARWAILTLDVDDAGAAATAASGNRVVLAYWDLGSDQSITVGNTLTLQNLELRGNEV